MKEYSELEGGHAIWNGRVTKGFRDFCSNQGYEIKKLISVIGEIIDTETGINVAVIGIGNLGTLDV